jgi:hypothetical protein
MCVLGKGPGGTPAPQVVADGQIGVDPPPRPVRPARAGPGHSGWVRDAARDAGSSQKVMTALKRILPSTTLS